MRTSYLLVVIFTGLILSGCATTKTDPQQTVTNTKKTTPHIKKYPPKNPIAVSFYTPGKQPAKPYVVLGKETISKYNFVGIKRQEASIHDAMRTLAASMGGDAVIDIRHSDKTVTGTVISYKQLVG